ncbi:MAG: EFR1 family ferrodoxin [Oscillospiraceae bacterium]|nr:EFR1 family ferrodoxin [Oscillospiraceae bacterium]
MIIQNVYAVYFSPTGNSKSVLKLMLSQIEKTKHEIDLTPYKNRNNSYSFSEKDLLIIGIPVYGGRVPTTAEERIKLLKGNNTPVVLVITYGDIHYFSAIFELKQIVNANGFITVGAAAIVAKHSVVEEIARDRPNAKELENTLNFTRQIIQKISNSTKFENITLRGKKIAFPQNMLPIKPYGNKKCTHCGTCVKLCPTQAITNPRKKASVECIRCMRCIKYCPQNARTYGDIKKTIAKIFLTIASHKEKESEFFM